MISSDSPRPRLSKYPPRPTSLFLSLVVAFYCSQYPRVYGVEWLNDWWVKNCQGVWNDCGLVKVLFQDLTVVSEENMENISIADVSDDIWIKRKRGEGWEREWVSTECRYDTMERFIVLVEINSHNGNKSSSNKYGLNVHGSLLLKIKCAFFGSTPNDEGSTTLGNVGYH
jgi:hypothetical protein